jgi:hypothetical protein
VIVSAAIASTGPRHEILTAWREGQWELVISPTILAEVERVLNHPRIARAYALARQEAAEILRLLASRASMRPGRVVIPRTTRDPAGDHVLACAIEGHADYLVTGDRDLLSIGRYKGIPIVSPAAFPAILQAAR